MTMRDLIYIGLFGVTILHVAKDLERGRWLLRIGPASRTSYGFLFDLTQFRRI
jgi:hypothetical protein